jgi:predicted nucleic acid-binding protein
VTDNLSFENSAEITHALAWYQLGADFADAMHLCICDNNMLYTFDSNFCKTTHQQGITPAFKVLK